MSDNFLAFLLLLVLILFCGCEEGRQVDSKYSSSSLQDSSILKIDSLYAEYYDWKYDSLEIMTIFQEIEKESHQKFGKGSFVNAHLQHTKGKVLYLERNNDGAIFYFKKSNFRK